MNDLPQAGRIARALELIGHALELIGHAEISVISAKAGCMIASCSGTDLMATFDRAYRELEMAANILRTSSTKPELDDDLPLA
ncbi:MAG TPA: hypothetical protein VLC08_16385 [Chitinolyticbacter sp.]|nr:hypothetical protein [Chitinolyticbacter sp.]